MRLRTRVLFLKVAASAPVPAPPPPPAPTVTSVSSTGATEGASIVHTVVLSGAPSNPALFSLALTAVTATGGGTDYTSALTNASFSNGVTIASGVLTVPAGVSTFTVTVATADDALVESPETYTLTVGGVSGTGTIADNDTAPGAGGPWQDDVLPPAGSASFLAEWGDPVGTPEAWVLLFGPTQLAPDADYTAFPNRIYIADGSARSRLVNNIPAGRYYWCVAPVEGGELLDRSQDFPEDAT